MRSPALAMAGNLMWTRSGTAWALWRVQGLSYGFRPPSEKHKVRAMHTALIRSLPGESLWMGICAGLNPAVVVERMLDGVEIDQCPDWLAECAATLDSLDEIGPGQRLYVLAVPLADTSKLQAAKSSIRAALADFRDQLALPRVAISPTEIEERIHQANKIEKSIPAKFAAAPMTPAQMVWLQLHAAQRGLFLDTDVPEQDNTAAQSDSLEHMLTSTAGSALPEVLLDEGGQTDMDKAALKRWNPVEHKYLKIQQLNAGSAPASYQALQVLSDVPPGGTIFPGSEFIGRIDESGLDVDWAMRLTVRSSDEVQAANRRALRNLQDQFEQREFEVSPNMSGLDTTAQDLGEYTAILEADKLEVEAQATVIFALGSDSADEVKEQARQLATHMSSSGYKLTQYLGYQKELWWAMLPGVPSTRAVREFTQITTSKALAATVPFASTELGDQRGSMAAWNISTGRTSVVLHDIAGATVRDTSGSMAIAGELGSGKALALDTPIPTPTGWSLMGDLAPGDLVFDEHGNPTRVVGVSPIMGRHRCFEVVFSDGSRITADAEHLWTTIPDRLRSKAAKMNYQTQARGLGKLTILKQATRSLVGTGWHKLGDTLTTEDIRGTLRSHGGGQVNHAIPTTSPLELPDVDLPVSPYVLGAWLGDGSSRVSQITSADPEIISLIEAEGYEVTKLSAKYVYAIHLIAEPPTPEESVHVRACRHCGHPMAATYSRRRYCNHTCRAAALAAGATRIGPGSCASCRRELVPSSTGRRCTQCWRSSTLLGRLRLLDLVSNKHIPPSYLRASIAQRRALLAGLLDTDGTVAPSGAIQFTNTKEQLARDVHELACSLGYRATLRPGRARLDGRDCGPKWTVAFTTNESVFWLTRKATAQAERTTHHSLARNRYRYIVDVREVASVPVRCIRVAAGSALFLAGPNMIPTHNSVFLKKLCGDVVDQQGQVIAIDRTNLGEWEVWARSITDTTVVNVDKPEYSLDPLRLFGSRLGSRVAQSFLITLLNLAPNTPEGAQMTKVLSTHYLENHRIASLGSLLKHLKSGDCEIPSAAELADRMSMYAESDFGDVIFNGSLPALPKDLKALVIRTHTLGLPNHAEMENEHLFSRMRLEKWFGRAVYALIAALAREICFSDPSRLGVLAVDECYHLTSSPEGEEQVKIFVRDGRKHRAAVLLGGHDPASDFGSVTLRGLIPTRILMRHRDRTLAKRGLEWIDLDPGDDELVEMIVSETSPIQGNGVPVDRRGEAFMRDSAGRIGRIKVQAPLVPSRFAAVSTSPVDSVGEPVAPAKEPEET